MAFPLTARGLRRITVNRIEYRWRLKAWTPDSHLFVYRASSTAPLRVTMRGWEDFWAMYPFVRPNEPGTIGSSFVRQAIEFGLQKGWKPDERAAPFEVEWNGETFRHSH